MAEWSNALAWKASMRETVSRVRIPPSPSSLRRSPKGEGEFHLFMYYVYILKCLDKRLYVGCANNLNDRIQRHIKGYISATRDRLPIKLICYIVFHNKYLAFDFEKYLKTGSGRVFINRHLI